MNAFALHDVSDQAVVRRWGTSAAAIVAAHAALIALGHELVHPAAGARRHAARDHGGHGAGVVVAAADADGPRAGTSDAAGRRFAARAGGRRKPWRSRSRRPRRRRSRRSWRRRSRSCSRRRQSPSPRRSFRTEAGAGEAENRPAGRQEAVGGAAGAAHQRATARRASGAGRIGDQRRRVGLRDGRLQSTRPRASACASSNIRRQPRPRASRASPG